MRITSGIREWKMPGNEAMPKRFSILKMGGPLPLQSSGICVARHRTRELARLSCANDGPSNEEEIMKEKRQQHRLHPLEVSLQHHDLPPFFS